MLTMLLCSLTVGAGDADLGAEANAVFKPLVRVSTGSATGSGTVLYSEDREGTGEFQTFILTNAHVVDDAIKVTKTWDSLHGRWIYREDNERVTVELFMYLRDGKTVVAQPVRADIVAHDRAEDLAVLRLDYPVQVANIARILPADKPLRLLQPLYAVGCSLGVDPIVTSGHVTDLEEQIERKAYVMVTSPIIYGNSGGAVLVQVDGALYFAGVPSRVTVMRNGQAITTMGYIIGIERIRNFLAVQKLRFFLDPAITPTQSMREREDLRDKVAAPPPEEMGPPPSEDR